MTLFILVQKKVYCDVRASFMPTPHNFTASPQIQGKLSIYPPRPTMISSAQPSAPPQAPRCRGKQIPRAPLAPLHPYDIEARDHGCITLAPGAGDTISCDELDIVLDHMSSTRTFQLDVQGGEQETARLFVKYPKLFDFSSRVSPFGHCEYLSLLCSRVLNDAERNFDVPTFFDLARSKNDCVTHEVLVWFHNQIRPLPNIMDEPFVEYRRFELYPTLPVRKAGSRELGFVAFSRGELSTFFIEEVERITGVLPSTSSVCLCGDDELISWFDAIMCDKESQSVAECHRV